MVLRCEANRRTLIIVKKLNFDGRSYMKDPDRRAKQILLEVGESINEDLSIERRLMLCEPTRDALGRCKAVYVLTGARDFDEAALAINPLENRIDSFSYFLIVSWQHHE